MYEKQDTCPVCGNMECALEEHYYDTFTGEMGKRFRCPECGAEFEAPYEWSGGSHVSVLPDTLENIMKAAWHLGHEDEDCDTKTFRELVERANEIAGKKGER